MEEKWYKADFACTTDPTIDIEPSYFVADNDEQAIEIAKEEAESGVDFCDIGEVETELIQVYEVDDTQEGMPEKRLIWY